MIGTTISHYRILEKLDEGGMGELYLARDLKLQRKVALKALFPELTRDEIRRERFLQEARAAAAIDHPYVASVYEILDDVGDRVFIAMEYVRGSNLRDFLRRTSVSLSEMIHLAVQIAEALAKMHEEGIVHRDLKPENILVSEEGYPKIVDFGLAKLIEAPLAETDVASSEEETAARVKTAEGQVLGTLAYMSPEQARGEPVDARSDLFSFGVVLYEMVSGEAPFKRPTALDTLSAILRDTPAPVKAPGRSSRPRLHTILNAALAKNPDERYQSARELAADLKHLKAQLERRNLAYSASFLTATSLLAVLLVAILGWWLARPPPPQSDVLQEPLSVLIGDFENLTAEPAFYGALEQALAIGLEAAPHITIYNRTRARQRLSQLERESTERLNESAVRLLCRRDGIKVAMSGSIVAQDGGYTISVRALDPVTAETLGETEERAPDRDSVLQAIDRVASRLRAELGDTTAESTAELARETFTTTSLEAMSSYARAQELQLQGRYQDAMAEYRSAIAQDPDFGRAYSGLAVMLANRGERGEADRYFRLALSHLDRMTEREKYRTRGAYYLATLNYEKAIEEFTALVNRYPADNAGHANLALAHFYSGNMDRALEEGRRAVEIYPNNVAQRNNVALYAMYAGRFETALGEADAVLELNPDFEKAYVARALSQLGLGRIDEARATYRALVAVSARGASLGMTGLADVALYQGQLEEASRLLERGFTGDVANENRAAAARKKSMLAETYLVLGEEDAATRAAEEAMESSQQLAIAYTGSVVLARSGRLSRPGTVASDLRDRLQPHPRSYGWLLQGEIHLQRGELQEAIDSIQAALELVDSWLGRFVLGRAFLRAGAFAEAHSELELCLKRRGEATAVFLDDVPSYRYFAPVHYYLGRAQEGLKIPAAAESYRAFLNIKESSEETSLVVDARRRLSSLDSQGMTR